MIKRKKEIMNCIYKAYLKEIHVNTSNGYRKCPRERERKRDIRRYIHKTYLKEMPANTNIVKENLH